MLLNGGREDKTAVTVLSFIVVAFVLVGGGMAMHYRAAAQSNEDEDGNGDEDEDENGGAPPRYEQGRLARTGSNFVMNTNMNSAGAGAIDDDDGYVGVGTVGGGYAVPLQAAYDMDGAGMYAEACLANDAGLYDMANDERGGLC